MSSASPYRIERLSSDHRRTDFSCGVEALDRYLQTQPGQDLRRNVAVPYVMLPADSQDVVGYYTLSMASVRLESFPSGAVKRAARYAFMPAALIGRLALDRRHQGRGLGSVLLFDALKRCYRLAADIGVVAVIVEAKDDSARAFYQAHDFASFQDDENRLFLPIGRIAKLFT